MTATTASPDQAARFWQRLLYRWLVQYNPLYLLSAALVLSGALLISSGLAQHGAYAEMLGVAVISELYAWTLIGGAALLTRIRLKRPAIMLALLAALYQFDLTLHTETCVYLDSAGMAGTALWLLSFAGKLFALAWAVQLRPSRSALGVPLLAGAGIALLPYWFRALDARSASGLVALWVFTLLALRLFSQRNVVSRSALDGWGSTVLRRSLRAVWTMWFVLPLGHAMFWIENFGLDFGMLLPVPLLLATRWVKSERGTYAVVASTLVLVGVLHPAAFAAAALLATITLGLRALRCPQPSSETSGQRGASGPYRTDESESPSTPARVVWTFAPAALAARQRLLPTALFTGYLSLWTLSWTGGSWPAHIPLLDAGFTLLVLGYSWLAGRRTTLWPLGVSYSHLGLTLGLLPAPHSLLEWGVSCVGVGFVLLLSCLGVSYRWRRELTERAAPANCAIK